MSSHRFPRAFVFDMDGVLKTSKGALPHAQATLDRLVEKNIPFRLMTNCPFLDTGVFQQRLQHWGLDVDPSLIYGAAHPLKGWLERHPLKSNQVWSLGVEPPKPYLADLGLRLDNHAPARKLGAIILFDDDYGWSTERVAEVFNLLLQNPDLPLIIPNPDLLFPERPDHFMLTSGSIGHLLQTLCEAKGRPLQPQYLGKPYRPLYRMTEEALQNDLPGLAPGEIVMIGDTPATDILGANGVGWQSWLVKTGGFRYGQHLQGATPNRTFENLFPILEELD